MTNADNTLSGRRVAILAADGVELVSSRNPDDLPAFTAAIVRAFEKGGL